LPRLFALLNIPSQAVALKKYFSGTCFVSKTSDNKDSSAPLWYSKVLRIKHSPRHAIPEFSQRSDNDSHIFAFGT
jgi:hypothetical protein